jgi:hypothetical protein
MAFKPWGMAGIYRDSAGARKRAPAVDTMQQPWEIRSRPLR